MHRCGIIDHGRNALLLEARLKCIALFPAIEANGVLRPTRIIAFGRDRSLYPAEINRKITKREYEKVVNYALDNLFDKLFIQELSSADKSFIPKFDFTGVL